jgi:hypothetical protein
MSTNRTSAAEAQSSESIRGPRMRADRRGSPFPHRPITKSAVAQIEPATAANDHPDRTDNRLRAYIASMRPLRGCCWREEIEEIHQRGRVLIERLAISARGDGDPEFLLKADECADVLRYMASLEPLDPRAWWRDPSDGPSHVVGFNLLLRALERSLREIAAPAKKARPYRLTIVSFPADRKHAVVKALARGFGFRRSDAEWLAENAPMMIGSGAISGALDKVRAFKLLDKLEAAGATMKITRGSTLTFAT